LEKTGGTPKGKTRSESEEKEESHEAKEHKLERKGNSATLVTCIVP
jgi:hypothetical protein